MAALDADKNSANEPVTFITKLSKHYGSEKQNNRNKSER